MNTNWNLIGLLIINLILALTGDALAKVWAVNHEARWFYIALAIGIVTIISFMLVVRSGGLTVGSTVALILTMIGNVLVGLFFFKETLLPTQWIGLALGFLAVLFMLNVIPIPK